MLDCGSVIIVLLRLSRTMYILFTWIWKSTVMSTQFTITYLVAWFVAFLSEACGFQQKGTGNVSYSSENTSKSCCKSFWIKKFVVVLHECKLQYFPSWENQRWENWFSLRESRGWMIIFDRLQGNRTCKLLKIYDALTNIHLFAYMEPFALRGICLYHEMMDAHAFI